MPAPITNYQCPACTGPLHFDGVSGKLVCKFCGPSFPMVEIKALYAEKDAKTAGEQTKAEAKREKTKAKKAADGDGWDVSGLEDDRDAEADGLWAY